MSLFLEVIEFLNDEGNEIVHRIPQDGSAETSLASQLIVRENQSAVFFRDGRALDTFGPGRHTLTTANLPVLKRVVGAAFGGKSPFRVEVYFVSKRVFTNAKWGTQEPVPFKGTGSRWHLFVARHLCRLMYLKRLMFRPLNNLILQGIA